MASDSTTKEFDTSLFLQFLFSVIFLFVCCFCLMLYVDKAFAYAVVFLLRFLVLPRNIRVGLTGLHFAPLQGRVLFRDFTFQTENLSLHIVDGYITFAFWGFWFRHPRWSRVHEYMVCDTLVGTRCRVRRNLTYVKGTVVAVNVEKRKVSVQFDEQSTDSSGDDEEGEDAETGTESHPDPAPGYSGDLSHSTLREVRSQDAIVTGGEGSAGRESAPASPQQPRRNTLKEFTTPVSVPTAENKARGSNPHVRSEGLGDEVVKVVDANDVYVRSRAGLLQIHLNGLRLCIYNATGKYLDLAKAAAAQAANSANATFFPRDVGSSNINNNSNTFSSNVEAAAGRKDKKDPNVSKAKAREAAEVVQSHSKVEAVKGGVKRAVVSWVRKAANNPRSWSDNDLDAQGMPESQMSAEVRAARKMQEHNILNTSFAQKFFNFIGCVELEIFSAHVDLGAVAGTHPYFLHLTFHQGEGRVFLTKDSCPALDLYRFVLELTLREVDARMAQMDSKLSKTQVVRNATLYERARLLFSGVAESYEHLPFESSSSSDLISRYGVLMDGKDKGTVHLVCYKDAANVYAGEPIRRDTLPTTGVEVLIDTPIIRYGPWLEYCRTQLWQYFLPPNYQPLQELQFQIGAPRPNAGFELLVLLLRDTTLEIPFKRRSIVPSPPFGIRDSRRTGMMVATVGAGAQYIQPAFFLLPKEEKQVFQGLFIAKDVTVWANCVLDRETILCHADSMQFFLDRQDDRLWNGRRLFNILTKLSGVEVYWYMVYVDYFLDLLNDWQFAASMYHDAPLTTELFNTFDRSVRDFIPNVKRFEVFIESTASIHLNVNTHNVVYAEDPNDLAHNIMATVKVQSGRFSVVLPSDQYQLSYENEVTRPLEASAHEVKAYISLPPSHPLYDQVSSEIPWAYSENFKLNGLFVMQVPNQSIPLSRDNLDTASGRTKLHNFFTLDIEFMNLRGTLMGTHIKALVQSFQNIFLDNTFTIAPDELFWLLAKLQSHATSGKNKRKEFKQFLEQSQPAGNDMEICVTVRLIDVSATATTGQAIGSPQVNLSTGLVTFTYVKQFAVTDTGVSLSPVTVRFPDRRGNFSRNAESSIVVGAITVALTKHFGRMPLKPKVHESMEVIVGGVSLEVTAQQLMMLIEVAQTIARHLMTEDLMMEAEVADALSAAELQAEKVVRAGPLRNTTDAPRGGIRRRRTSRGGADVFGSAAVPAGSSVPAANTTNASFPYNLNEIEMDEHDDVDGDDEPTGEAVEAQEWRSARRAAASPHGYRFPVDTESEEGDVHVDVQPSASVVRPSADASAAATTTAAAAPSSQQRSTVVSQEPLEEFSTGGGGIPILQSFEFDGNHCFVTGKHGHARKRRRLFFADSSTTSSRTSDSDHDTAWRHPFAATVPYDVALGFANFMEECNKADDNSKDYGLFFLVVSVGSVSGVVRIGEDGYASLELPVGVTMAQSTVNDGNSNRRLSAAAKDVGVQLMLHRSSEVALGYLPSLKDDPSVGNYLEVLSLHTSLCLRQYVAYPFDNSLENHREKQKQFVEDNDYERLIGFPFKNAATHCPPTPQQEKVATTTAAAAAAAATAERGAAGGAEVPSPVRKAQSAAAAMPEPATLPRPTPLSQLAPAGFPPAAVPAVATASAAASGTAGGVGAATAAQDASRVSNQSQLCSASVPLSASGPPTTRSWVATELPLALPDPALDQSGSSAPVVVPRAFTKGSYASDGSDGFSDSRNTTAHNQRGKDVICSNDDDDDDENRYRDAGKLRGCTSNLSETMIPTDKEKMESSNRFATCVSLSTDNSSSSFADSTDDFFQDTPSDGDSSRRAVDNRAFAADRSSSGSGGEDKDGPTRTLTGKSPPLSPGLRSNNSNGRKNWRQTRGGANPGVGSGDGGGSGPTKSTVTSSSVPPHLFYRTFDKAESDDNGICAVDYWPPQRPSGPQRVRDRTGFHSQLPIVGFYPNVERQNRAPSFFAYMRHDALQREEDLFAWARCVVDNRERSKHNSTSRHLHLALLDPLTILVTPEAAVLAGAAARLLLQVHVSLRGPTSELPRAESSSFNAGTSASPTTMTPRLLRSHAKKSKARTQQKRWLWEDNIVSLSVHTIEGKVLTRLPVPVENLPDPSQPVDGVYTSTVLVRNVRGIMAQNRPPNGEEVSDASQKVSGSLKLDTFAVITQIEWEPLRREGNVFARVPHVWYDTAKPTMALLFLTQVAGKGKRDLWRGTDGGACNITIAQIASHVTRDFADYVHELLHLIKTVVDDVQGRVRAGSQAGGRCSISSPLYGDGSSGKPVSSAVGSPHSPELGPSAAKSAEVARVHKGGTIQGKGFLGSLTVTFIDTERVGQQVVVRESEVSRLELVKPFCNFVVVMPSLLRDRQLHIQGVGEIDLVKVHVLPSVLHVLHPCKGKLRSSAIDSNPLTSNAGGGTTGTTGTSPRGNSNNNDNNKPPTTATTATTNVPTFLSSPETVIAADATTSFSQMSPQQSMSIGRQVQDDHKPLQVIYDGTFTVHQLDLGAKHSDSNYVRFTGKELTGCAESRMESVASRECVQTEALTEAIAELLKARLRYKANRARERAKRSRYPAPPDSTEQLHLHSTASFFANQVRLYYVAECVMDPISHEAGLPGNTTTSSPKQSIQKNRVLSADISNITLVAQFASQFIGHGDQTNLHMIVHNVVFDCPYCLRAADMLHPQVHMLVSSWREAVKTAAKSMRRRSSVGYAVGLKSVVSGVSRPSFSFSDREVKRMRRNSAVTLQMQATSITGYVGLPQGIVQKFLLPQISCFTKSSSNGRVDVKMHLHPFTITAHNAPLENYRVVLPHVYVLYAHDSIKMLCNVTMGTVAITITPLFINHILLTYEKVINDMLAVVASPGSSDDNNDADGPLRRETSSRNTLGSSANTTNDDVSQDTPSGNSSSRNNEQRGGRGRDTGGANLPSGTSWSGGIPTLGARTGGHRADSNQRPNGKREGPLPPAAPRHRRQSFLFLLQGVRLSYLTTLTTLRFTIRSLNATADTSEGDSRHTLRWVVNVTDAQAALVDRDDHDQMIATYKNLSSVNKRESPTMAGVAQMEPPVFGYGLGAQSASTLKEAHPLGGFLWGSVGLSLTLSSGKVDENRFSTALQQSDSFNSYSEELQKALIESLTNSTSKWELTVYEPLVILRIGLDALIKECVRETEDDVREMKRVSYEDSLTAGLRLHRLKRFQRLQLEKKRIDSLLRRAQKERQRRLRTMTERVAHDVSHRRGGLYVEGTANGDEILGFFSTVKAHRVVATVTNFMVVVPFGDAPFRSILEELPDTFACGKSDRHIHTAACLDRRKFIPSHALKMKMDNVSFICNLEVVKRLVPILVTDPRTMNSLPDSIYGTGGSADQGYVTTVLFLGRLLALDSHVFFTDGSPLNGETTLHSILHSTSVLGGRGLLTSYVSDEHEASLNSLTITSIEAPLRIEKKASLVTLGLVVDVSEPKGRISSLFMSILREFSLEQATAKLSDHIHHRRRVLWPARQSVQGGGGNAPRDQRVLYREEEQAPTRKEPVSLHLDITGRLEASELAVFCYENPERFSTASPNASNGGGGGGGLGLGGVGGISATGGGGGGVGNGVRGYTDPHALHATKLSNARRRVGFDTGSPNTRNSRWGTQKPSAGGRSTDTGFPPQKDRMADMGHERYLIMSIPLPGITVRAVVRRGRREGVDDIAIVRTELRAGTIELSPYITALAQEVEMCTTLSLQQRVEHNKHILAFVQQMEEEVPQLGVPLHCPLVEVLLPMPRAYASALAKEEMNTVVRLRSSKARGGTAAAATSAPGAGREEEGARTVSDHEHVPESEDDASVSTAPAPPRRKARGLVALHFTVSDFRLIFNTEPAASTSFTVYLDKGGTIDFVFKHFIRNDTTLRFVNKFPDVSLAVTLRRLRAECQTRLEVKSLEMFLPEAEVTISRRSGQIGLVDNIAAYFPFNVEGTEPNVTIRLQHVSQLFLVTDMWSFTISETLRSIRHLFARGAAGDDIAKRMVRTQLGQQVARSRQALREMQATVLDRRTILFIGLTRALCFCDIGAGSAHNFTIGEAHIIAEASARATGCAVDLLTGRVTNMSIRSEGVLSGGMIIGDIFAKGFVIQNAEDAEVFLRTPEQRTFREALLVRQVHVNFKERQLKDVFECKIGDFRGNSMDGIGEEDYTTTDLDVALQSGTLGVTPSTVPAVLSFVRNISSIITEQRRISAARLQEKTFYLQPSANATRRSSSVATTPMYTAATPTANSAGAAASNTAAGGGRQPMFNRAAWANQGSSSAATQHSDDDDGSDTSSNASTQPARGCIPYFGNRLLRVPCGQLRIGVDDTRVLLGAISSGEATAGCVVISFAKGRLSFAECPCDDYHAAKKVLVIETHNVELYRPGAPRVVVMGFQGVNHFEFYTRQVLGSPVVGFTLTLRQTNPWTGNPRFRDFEEMIQLIKSFTDKKNADVIRQFGRMDTTTLFDLDTPLRRGSGALELGAGIMDLDSQSSLDISNAASPTVDKVAAVVKTDERKLKALRSSKFSPQLRFGGDVSVNTEVILNWLGVTEKMLPHVVHMALCDKLENMLNSLAALASERVQHRKLSKKNKKSKPPLPEPVEARKLDFH